MKTWTLINLLKKYTFSAYAEIWNSVQSLVIFCLTNKHKNKQKSPLFKWLILLKSLNKNDKKFKQV